MHSEVVLLTIGSILMGTLTKKYIGPKTQSTFEILSPSCTVYTVTNPLVSLDGMHSSGVVERGQSITDASLYPTSALWCRLYHNIDLLPLTAFRVRATISGPLF